MNLLNSPEPKPRQRAQGLPDVARILLVEDQRFDRLRIMRMCGGLDMPTEVVEASTLAAMIRKLSEERFDLVLIDYHLPDGTGLQGVEMVREDFVNRHAATIMVTGTAETEIAAQALRSGFSDYLTKEELSVATLRRAVITALQKSRLVTGMEATGEVARQTNAVLHRFSRECAQEIKPVVSRMMRQLREVKHMPPDTALGRVEELEKSCDRLWTFLNDLERFGGNSETPPKPSVVRPSRPPSPFSRRVN